jgi:cytochrome P450
MCLGKSMAELEGVFVIVCLLRRYSITVIGPENVTYGRSVTLPMKNGLKVKVSERSF